MTKIRMLDVLALAVASVESEIERKKDLLKEMEELRALYLKKSKALSIAQDRRWKKYQDAKQKPELESAPKRKLNKLQLAAMRVNLAKARAARLAKLKKAKNG